MSKKNQRKTFEDVCGNTEIFIGEVMSYEGEPVTEFAIIASNFKGKELSVSLISKSDIPRLIRELTKFI